MALIHWTLLLIPLLVIKCYAHITTFPSINPIRTSEGEDLLEIKCRYDGADDGDGPSFTWSGPSVGDDRVEIVHRGRTSTLRIHDVSASDNGTFKCTHRSGEFATKDVIVHVDPTVEAPSPQMITVEEDGSSIILCMIDLGYPPDLSEVVWYKDGTILDLDEDRYDATDLDLGLQITDIDPLTDSGTYLCAVDRSGVGIIPAEIEVAFIPRSELAPKIDKDAMGYSVQLDCGEDLALECILKSSSESADTFEWSTPDGYYSGQRLTISSPVKSGQYRCIAGNDDGTDAHTVSVNAKAAPMQLRVNYDVEVVQEGGDIEIACDLSDAYPGNPLAEISWSKAGRTILDDSNERIFVRKNSQSSTLVIMSAMASDGGDYECVAVNECDVTSRTVTLDVMPTSAEILCAEASSSECSISDDEAQELIETVCSSCQVTNLECDEGQYSITISGMPEDFTEEHIYSALGLKDCSFIPPNPESRVDNVSTIASITTVVFLVIIIFTMGLTLYFYCRQRSKNRTADISDVEQSPPPTKLSGQQPTVSQFTTSGDS